MSDAIRVERAAPGDLDACLEIRRRVFVREQGVSESLDSDGLDGECAHFLAWRGREPIATARLRVADGRAKAERVAVLASLRHLGIGRALMERLEAEAAALGCERLALHAQESVVPFYEHLGYTADGGRFFEAGIPHRAMWKALPAERRSAGG